MKNVAKIIDIVINLIILAFTFYLIFELIRRAPSIGTTVVGIFIFTWYLIYRAFITLHKYLSDIYQGQTQINWNNLKLIRMLVCFLGEYINQTNDEKKEDGNNVE